jgi:hypothetical protein
MKTRHFVEALLCVMAALAILDVSPVKAADVSLVDKGQTGAAIFVDPAVMKEVDPKKPGQKLWQQADAASQRLRLQASVRDLAYCLEKMTGAKLEIVEGAPAADEKALADSDRRVGRKQVRRSAGRCAAETNVPRRRLTQRDRFVWPVRSGEQLCDL